MPLLTTTPPTAEPIDVAEARLHCKQDITADDPLLAVWVGHARAECETKTQRQLVSARFTLVLDSFPGSSQMGVPFGSTYTLPGHAIVLPKGPLIQVVSIKYLDMQGVWQTLDPAWYTVEPASGLPRITPVFGRIWPIPLPQIGAVQVTFDAGYVAPMVVDVAANSISVQGWKTMVAGDVMRLSNSGGALPAPLKPNTDYAVLSVLSPGVYTLALPGSGSVIDITSAGTGTSFVGDVPMSAKAWMLTMIASLFEHRGQVAVVKGKLEALPFIDGLLDSIRVVS